MKILCRESLLSAPSERVPPQILLLDEDSNFCQLVRSVLSWHRFAVTIVHRGADGIRELLQRDYDAIVFDTNVTGMSPETFYLAVYRIKNRLCRRLILMSEQTESAKIEEFLAKRQVPVAYKPLATADLIEKIAQTTAQARAAEESAETTARVRRMVCTPMPAPAPPTQLSCAL